MRVPILLAALSIALLPAPAASAADQSRHIADAPELIRAAIDERNARKDARLACMPQPVELQHRIVEGTVDAERMAKDAAARGCFGMVTTVNGIPFGISVAPGVECRPNARLLDYGQLQLLSFSIGSDVVSLDREESERDARAIAAYSAFARTYNAAILAHPGFPYGDLCRPAAPDYRSSPAEQLRINEWGFRPLEVIEEPRDIYQAARRGTLKSLQRLIENHPIDIHVPDILDLTPLAWAVIYNRPDHMRLLLAAGANPYGGAGRTNPSQTSPFMIARNNRNRELVAIMRPALEARKLSIPPLPAKLDETRSHQVDTGFKTFELNISPEGRVTDCHLLLGGDRFVYPATCDRIQRAMVYLPAEDGDGNPVAATVNYTFTSLGPRPDLDK